MTMFRVLFLITYFCISFFIFFKKWYLIRTIQKVYIPNFKRFKNKFINDTPLKLLRRKRNSSVVFIIIFVIIVSGSLYSLITYVTWISIFLSYITCFFKFKAMLHEFDIFSIFSSYLTKQ